MGNVRLNNGYAKLNGSLDTAKNHDNIAIIDKITLISIYILNKDEIEFSLEISKSDVPIFIKICAIETATILTKIKK